MESVTNFTSNQHLVLFLTPCPPRSHTLNSCMTSWWLYSEIYVLKDIKFPPLYTLAMVCQNNLDIYNPKVPIPVYFSGPLILAC